MNWGKSLIKFSLVFSFIFLFTEKSFSIEPTKFIQTLVDEASKILFEKVNSRKVKINIFKEYKLENAVDAHKDLEGRNILGPAVIIP